MQTRAQTGEALLHTVTSGLSDVQLSFTPSDGSSHRLLERTEDDSRVREMASGANEFERSSGWFHARRKAEGAGGDKPDIIVSSTADQDEVAVE